MADEEQLAILRQGSQAWNKWLQDAAIGHPAPHTNDLRGTILRGAVLRRADLSGADLSFADLSGAILRHVDLRRANLRGADVRVADLVGADLRGADLRSADLSGANLYGTNLRHADLRHADLSEVALRGADLGGADLRGASLVETTLHLTGLDETNLSEAELFEAIFGDVDLSSCKGLETCRHYGPSFIDHRTLQRSGPLPIVFLRGAGLADNLIDYLPSLLNQAIRMYSCFISYSAKDDEFAQRLHADLQAKGVRCWFAPNDMRIGDKTRVRLDEAIRLHEKLLLVLSENSIASVWVEKEVETAFERERETGSLVLFPVRLDDAVMGSTIGWAADIKRSRHIGDFRRWKEHDAYTKALERLLRDLKVVTPEAS